MKKKSKILLFLIVIVLLTSGCTKQLKDSKGKIVKNDTTGQTLPANILCKPTDKDIIKLYDDTFNRKTLALDKQLKNGDISKKEYKDKKGKLLNINNLPACKSFKISSGGYEGLWTNIFVKPLAWILIKLGSIVKNYGVAVIIATIIIRSILLPITIKSFKQSELMKKAQVDLSKLEKKYKNKNDQESMTQKSQEMMMIYKKHGINPMSGCVFGFIQIPLFLAFYESLYRLPVLFEDKFLIYNMATTPMSGFGNHHYLYLLLPVIVGIVTYFSFKANAGVSNEAQAKQMKTMMNVMLILIIFTSLSMSTAIILYWITNSSFTIVQNMIMKRSRNDD